MKPQQRVFPEGQSEQGLCQVCRSLWRGQAEQELSVALGLAVLRPPVTLTDSLTQRTTQKVRREETTTRVGWEVRESFWREAAFQQSLEE